MSPWSTLWARLFQWRIMSSYLASHSTTTCRWTSVCMMCVACVFTIYARCDTFDQPSPPVTPTRLHVPSWAHDSNTLTPSRVAYHRRTSIVFIASKIRWLGASWTLKFTRVWMRCYNNYTGCLSISELTSNMWSWHSLLAHPPPVRTWTHQLPEICHPVCSALKILACLLFPGPRQSLVRAHFALLLLPLFNSLPRDIRSTGNISTFCHPLKMFYFRKAFD
jgi:hypothetical protein